MGGGAFTVFLIIVGVAALICVSVPLIKLILRTRFSEGRALEAELNNLYLRCQNNLFISELVLKEIGDLESTEADRVADLMRNVVTARYQNISGGNMPAFLTENYPDLRNLGVSYERLASEIIKRRDEFRNYQEQLAFKIEAFEKWRTATVRAWIFARDFPDGNLKAIINGTVIATGKAALQKMQQLISSGQVNAVYHTGIYSGNNVKSKSPVAATHSAPVHHSPPKPPTEPKAAKPAPTIQSATSTSAGTAQWVAAAAADMRIKRGIGRNDPCPCGSGKKYKKCCGEPVV